MKKKNIKLRKLESIGNRIDEYNNSCIRKDMKMNMINGLQKWGCLMQKRQLKTIGQGIQVETYKGRGGKIPLWTIQTIYSNNSNINVFSK